MRNKMTFALVSTLVLAGIPAIASAATIHQPAVTRTANFDYCRDLAAARGSTPLSSTHEYKLFMEECEAGQIRG